MKLTIPTAYRRSLHFAVVVQLVAVLLSACVDDDGSFIAITAAAWALFWAGAITLTRLRQAPTKTELVTLRYGPLAIPILIFTIGQYL